MEKIKMNLKKISESIIEFPETEGLPLCDHTYKFTYYENEYGDEFTTFKIDDEMVFTVRNMSTSMLLSQPSSFILEELGMGFLTTINVDSIRMNEYYADDISRFMIVDYTGKYVYLKTNLDSTFSEEQMKKYNIYLIDGQYYIKCGLVPNAVNTPYECSFITSIISYFDELDLNNIHDSYITFIDEYTTALKNVKIIIK